MQQQTGFNNIFKKLVYKTCYHYIHFIWIE
jgi:hypothetical protein